MREQFSPAFPFIVIDGDADYVLRLRHILGKVARRRTGQVILEEIRAQTGSVTIEPMPGAGIQNADAALVVARRVRIRYSTAPFLHRRAQDGTINFGPAWSADAVLCHELAHAARQVAGVVGTLPTFPGCPHDIEEFCATQVTNVYSAEAGEALLASYSDRAPMNPRGFRFSPGAAELLQRFAEQQPRFFAALARIRVSFNPFAGSGRG